MDAFTVMTQLLTRPDTRAIKRISTEDYEVFCKEFLFNKLRDQTFGTSFCRRFEVSDYVLEILPSEESAKRHIRAVGYINDTCE